MIVLYIILGIIALYLLMAVFVKKDIASTKQITIDRPANEVFNYIKYLKNQLHYSKWATMDPNTKNTYIGTDGQPGFINKWEGNKKVGVGEQEITAVTDNALHTELRFIKPFPSTAKSTIVVNAINNTSCTVSWGFASKMHYPMNGVMLFMNMSALIGKDFEVGLQNLKKLMEK